MGYCSECGIDLGPGAEACDSCGRPVDHEASPEGGYYRKEAVSKGLLRQDGRTYSVSAFAFAVLALVAFPPLFALVAVALGYMGYRRGDVQLGMAAIAVGIMFGIIGMLLGVMVWNL